MMYLLKEEAQKTVPSEYTESIQKKPKGSNRRGKDKKTSPAVRA